MKAYKLGIVHLFLLIMLLVPKEAESRVIPEQDRREIKGDSYSLFVGNSGSYGEQQGLLQAFDGKQASYLYAGGWVIACKFGDEWLSYSTIDWPFGDADFVPGSFEYGDEYLPDLKDYQQVYLAKDYEKDTGWERFGGLGPRWPLWRGEKGSELYNEYGPYGFHIADTLILEQATPVPDALPALPERLSAISKSKAWDDERGIKLELQVFYSLVDEAGFSSHARLVNKGVPLDSVYLINIADIEINDPDLPFQGSGNDIGIMNESDTGQGTKDFAAFTSERGAGESQININYLYLSGLWASPRDSEGKPLSKHSDLLIFRNEAKQAAKLTIMTIGDIFGILEEGPLAIASVEKADSIRGDLWSALYSGPYKLEGSDERAELTSAYLFSEKSSDSSLPDWDLAVDMYRRLYDSVIERDYLTISGEKNSISFDNKEIYFEIESGHFFIVEESGERIYISIDGRAINRD